MFVVRHVLRAMQMHSQADTVGQALLAERPLKNV